MDLKINKSFTIKNVLLEVGFKHDGDEIVGTRTELFALEVEGGLIKAIHPNTPDANVLDAKSKLLLPAFRDMHAHLDKHLFGLPWKAVAKARRTVKDMIALEQQIIPRLLETTVSRTEQLIAFLQSYGTHYSRSHFNVDPTSKLDSLYHLEEALNNKKDGFGAELVAFPQHGIYYTDSRALMKEAAALDSVGFIGGLDPYSIDGSIEQPMDFVIQLALDNDKGIDIHLHEIGDTGMKTINYLIDHVMGNPQLQHRTYISHSFALGHLSPGETENIAERLAQAGVGIATSVPFGGTIMPIPTLLKHGVEVVVGNDNIQDHWGTFGSGNMLQKMNLIAQLYGYGTERALAKTLALATGGIIPLDDQGNQQWPKIGDKADFVLVDASCSAEAVSRVSPITSLVHHGSVVFGL